MSDFEIYNEGFCRMSICTSLQTIAEIEKRINDIGKTGWKVSGNNHFADGNTNPCSCEDKPDTHRHYLMNLVEIDNIVKALAGE